MSFRFSVALLLAALGQGAPSEMTTEDILDRHFEALGGRHRLEAIRTLEKAGTYVYNGQEHPLRSFHLVGNKYREEIDGLVIWGASVKEGHSVIRGADGTTYWVVDDTRYGRFREVANARASLTIADADLQGALFDHERKGHVITYDGLGDVEGASAHRLRVTLPSGFELVHFLDETSFLVLKKEVVTKEGARDLEHPRAWFYEDYRAVDGVLFPFWIYVEEPIFSREYVFDSIVANPSLDESIFEAPPDAIKSP